MAEDLLRDTTVDPIDIDSSAVVLKSTTGEPPVSSENPSGHSGTLAGFPNPPSGHSGTLAGFPNPPSEGGRPVLFGGRYEALGVLGGGAMGTVYRAKDRALDETVALKLLRSELAVSPELVERFRREVKLARRVTHRNIARVFDIGAHGPQPFLTMELIEGVSLAEMVTQRGLLPARDVVTIAIELCAGLTAAHEAGVVHRDLKPENVVVHGDGRPIITDFGVACALTERDLPYGASSAFVGSPAYMAPEQVAGAADIDARADVYALGVMLFELLTGHLPWEEGGVFAVAAARLVRAPPDPRDRAANVPDALAEIVLACMETKKDARIASAKEVARRLTKLPASAISIPPPTMQVGGVLSRRALGKAIAIMPLKNDAHPDVDYFCRGYSAELADFLSSAGDIQVRLSFLAGDDPRENARVLGVQTFVTGSLRSLHGPAHEAGGALRLSVRLVTVQDGLTLWSKRFDGSSAMDLALAARESAAEIGLVLAASAAGMGSRSHAGPTESLGPPVDSRARDLHKRGRFAYQRAWFEATEEAVRLLEEAHALTPNDPIIAGTLALALARAYGVAGASATLASRARSLAEKALQGAPRLADPRVALASLHAYDGEGVAAAGELRRALSASPDAVEALDWMGRLLVEVGDTERGLAYLDRVLSLEPSMIGTKLTATLVRGLLGDWERVAQDLSVAPAERQDRVLYTLWRSRIALWRNDTTDPAVVAAASDEHVAIATMARVVQTKRIDANARSVIEQMLPTTDCAPRRAIYNAQIRAEVFAHVGSLDEANAALRDADTNGFFDHVWLERCACLAPLRDTPDFQRVLRNVAARAARVRAALR